MRNLPDGLKIYPSDGYGFGLVIENEAYRFAFANDSDSINLLLIKDGDDQRLYTIEIGREYKNGNVFSFQLSGVNLDGYLYCYEVDREIYVDPYSTRVVRKKYDGNERFYGVISPDVYDWKDDMAPSINASDLILYKLHAKGFTMNRYSKVKHKGTFMGIAEKIPYFTDLGINAIEIMPPYSTCGENATENFWGYETGLYFTPNQKYCVNQDGDIDYTDEFKTMVRKLHANGIEVIIELYFPREIKSSLIVDCVRFWKKTYHIDGVHLYCDERVRYILAEDDYLKKLKLFCTNWSSDCGSSNLFEYNDGFLEYARKLLKGDENQLSGFIYAMRKHPDYAQTVNYVANNNGFTLADTYSYDRKHNEDNGENNRDGADFNLSWNCGIEGPTKTKKVLMLRQRLMKGAMTMLLTAQGVPLIYAGDEFGNSQNGNNNAYCQDNEIGWVDWSAFNRNKKYFSFVKELITFRKAHKILHMEKEPYMMDYKYYGMPDVSYHGSKAWYPGVEHYNRHIGIMSCGRYAGEEENIYIAFNYHWEAHELALPNVPDCRWKVVLTTGSDIAESDSKDRVLNIEPRTAVILVTEKNS